MKRETSIVYVSNWVKDDHHCAVHSKRKAGEKTAEFWFTDWNPFPCMKMTSTFAVVGKWLTENGWHREIPARILNTIDTVDETTGELIERTTTVYNYIPVHKEKTAEPDLDDCNLDDCIMGLAKIHFNFNEEEKE